MTSNLLTQLRSLLAANGYSKFWHEVNILRRERLQNYGREKKKRYSKSTYQKLFDRQKGICPWCGFPLQVPARYNEIDHVNPNEQDCDNIRNLQLLHGANSDRRCNQKKNAKSIQEQAKEKGKTFEQLVRVPESDESTQHLEE